MSNPSRRTHVARAASRFDLDAFIDDVKRARAEADGQRAVHEVLARAVAEPGSVIAGLGEPRQAGIHELYRADDLTMLNVVWAPLMILLPHEHLMWATIGIYTLSDSHASREYDTNLYIFATQATTAVTVSLAGLTLGRGRDLTLALRTSWKMSTVAAFMTIAAYGLVLIAVRHAPVGYVAALRESSVLIAVLVGSRYLGEGQGRLRLLAAGLIVSGLVLLVISR